MSQRLHRTMVSNLGSQNLGILEMKVFACVWFANKMNTFRMGDLLFKLGMFLLSFFVYRACGLKEESRYWLRKDF